MFTFLLKDVKKNTHTQHTLNTHIHKVHVRRGVSGTMRESLRTCILWCKTDISGSMMKWSGVSVRVNVSVGVRVRVRVSVRVMIRVRVRVRVNISVMVIRSDMVYKWNE